MTAPTRLCESCVFYRTEPMDCIFVPSDAKHRSLRVVARVWSAETECREFTPKPSADDVAWAGAVLRHCPTSRWAGRIVDSVSIGYVRDSDQVCEIMENRLRLQGRLPTNL